MSVDGAPLTAAAIEAVIFDLDGVLADSEPVHLAASRRVVAPAEIVIEDYVRFIGGGAESYSAWIEQTYGIARATFSDLYTLAIVDALKTGPAPAMAGADAVVRAVHRRGIPVAVASMSKPEWVYPTLEAIGLSDLFSLVVTGAEVAHPKPDPDIYLHTAALLGTDPTLCLAVEDSVHGVAAAAAAGMGVVQIRQGFMAPDRQPGAHAVIEHWSQFNLGWLEGVPLPGRV